MTDLNPRLLARLRALIGEHYSDHEGLRQLVFDVLDERTDYEHVLTFLEESPNALHRELATEARQIFRGLLTNELERAVSIHGGIPNELYQGLLDLHAVEGFPEELAGLITLNYDGFLEDAVGTTGRYQIEWGVMLNGPVAGTKDDAKIPLIKLHGSFEWQDCFPVRPRGLKDPTNPLWIPPGVVKEKRRYPFNSLWGRVREVLDCDILRIVGWNMGPNDWELISLLFSTRHGNDLRSSYRVELIASPSSAMRLREKFPYLGIKSILETERAGEVLIGEYLQRKPTTFDRLGDSEQERVVKAAGQGKNWFLEWLKRNVEWAHVNLDIGDELTGAKRVLEGVA